MASRRRCAPDQVKGSLSGLRVLPIVGAEEESPALFELPAMARAHCLTNYDAAWPALAMRAGLQPAKNDRDLRRAAAAVGITIFSAVLVRRS